MNNGCCGFGPVEGCRDGREVIKGVDYFNYVISDEGEHEQKEWDRKPCGYYPGWYPSTFSCHLEVKPCIGCDNVVGGCPYDLSMSTCGDKSPFPNRTIGYIIINYLSCDESLLTFSFASLSHLLSTAVPPSCRIP